MNLDLNTLDLEEQIKNKLLSNNINSALKYYDNYYSLYFSQNLEHNRNLRSLKNHIIILTVSLSRTLCYQKNKCLELNTICTSFISRLEKENSILDVLNTGKKCIINFYDFLQKCEVRCDNYIINNVIDFIEKNLDEDLNLDLIANKVHISKNYLSILFQSKTNKKLSYFINELRVKRAKELLNTSSFSLSYISDLCGFKTQSYFSTIFKKITNISPLEYKKCIERF